MKNFEYIKPSTVTLASELLKGGAYGCLRRRDRPD